DQSRVHLDRRFGLVDDHLLGVQLLSGDHFLLRQPLIALEIEARVREVGLVPRELPLGLHELGLEGAGVDLGQELAGVDDLALREVRRHQLAVDAALHRDGVERGDGAERREVDAQVAGAGRRDDHRDSSRRLSDTSTGRLRRQLRHGLTTVGDPGAYHEEARETHEDDENATAAASRTYATFRNCFAFSLHPGPLIMPAGRSRVASQHTAEPTDMRSTRGRVCFVAMRLSRLPLALTMLVSMAVPAAADHPRSADEVLAEVRRPTEQYRDIARARADGFVQVSGMEARHGYHFMNNKAPVLTAAGMAAS